ncbi:thioredoxin [Streptomyces sp. VRA16 Mangrove soil]|uniref:thioredoxin n=1 Tax=Streptomyces sp. VRA16 Mangrove soil TaxID=2817434 RepID=UPI001A9DB92A|nr:thioredoxin [Streptomyces sp. VRA16 Mangrove soil]MBO1336457.1 thioredoxin [Streptomyces sp. VRA16 Mangrove soil]
MAFREVTNADFDEQVVKSGRPVLVEFTAEWCGPCNQLAPVLKAVAEEERERLDVVAIDVDANPDIAVQYGVLSMPTLMVFKDGEPVWSRVGARPKRRLLEELAEAL